ncbi:rhodanese-like domain-containing protein [Rhodocytophaga rosea]|uniref:Rhodanese-like domain-containing protein n=2 Tax=Rhodocytophaga rosea TaxID=2704465 RepID=A0A6C0GVN8_9BACT|nr:rhodanese-like domain-containing protein [Rhodocytophaga rosea]
MFSWFKTNKKYQDLNANDFQKQLSEDENAHLLDVRTNDEFASGHISGAENLNISDAAFSRKLALLDKNKSYYVYCRSGGRSGQACSVMADLGFTKVYNLNRGILGWNGQLIRS